MSKYPAHRPHSSPTQGNPSFSATPNPARRQRSWFFWIGLILAFALVFVVVAIAMVVRAYRHKPEFYQEALDVPPEVLASAGDELERRVLELQNQVRRGQAWTMTFSEDQVNGWLMNDLPEKFPDALPSGVMEPRIRISNGKILFGALCRKGGVETVLWLEASVGLTERQNEVAIEVVGLHAGGLPLPLKAALDQASQAAIRAKVPLAWGQRDGKPVATLRIPETDARYAGKRLQIDQVELRGSEFHVAGRMLDK